MNRAELLRDYLPRRETLLLGAIIGVALTLRLYALTRFPLWYDEVAGLLLGQNLVELLQAGDISTDGPLGAALVVAWYELGFQTPWTMRLMSVIAGTILVGVVYAATTKSTDSTTGLLTALFTTFCPIVVYYSQEFRHYILLALLFWLALLTLEALTGEDSNKSWLWPAFVSLTIGCGYIHPIGLLLAALLGLYALLITHGTELATKTWIAVIAIGAATLPYAIYVRWVVSQMISHEFWIPDPSPWSLVYTAKNIFLGYSAWQSWELLAAGLLGIASVGGAIRSTSRFRLLFGTLAALPVSTLFLASLATDTSFYLDRSMLPIFPIFAAGLAAFALSLPRRWLTWTFAAAYIAMASVSLMGQYQNQLAPKFEMRLGVLPKMPYRRVVDVLEQQATPDDLILHYSSKTHLPLMFYLPDIPHQSHAYDPDEDLPMERVAWSYDSHWQRIAPSHPITRFSDHDATIWLVSASWAWPHRIPDNAVIEWLDRHYERTKRWQFDGIILFRYEPTE